MAPQPSSAVGYAAAWGEIARSMESGVSWSGHERNVAWVQAGGGHFVDVSAITGLDQVEDGRVALRCDWDGDGDLDLWLRFRSGPTLRYMENRADPARHVVFDPGRPGASVVVETTLGDETHRTLLQTRTADGYLAGVRRRAVIALRPEEEVVGAERLVEQGVRVRARPAGSAPLAAGALPAGGLPGRVVLRTALPLPAERLRQLGFRPGRPQVLVVADPECAVCAEVLPAAIEAIERDGRLGLTRLNTGNPEDLASVQWASTTAAHILGPGAQLDTPLALLVGPGGQLQVVTVGALDWDVLSQDAGWFALKPVQGALRASFDPPGASRWFHGMARSGGPLAQELLEAGFESEAAFYSR